MNKRVTGGRLEVELKGGTLYTLDATDFGGNIHTVTITNLGTKTLILGINETTDSMNAKYSDDKGYPLAGGQSVSFGDTEYPGIGVVHLICGDATGTEANVGWF